MSCILPVLFLDGLVLLPQATIPWRHVLGHQGLQRRQEEPAPRVLVVSQNVPGRTRSGQRHPVGCIAELKMYPHPSGESTLGLLQGQVRARYELLPMTSDSARQARVERFPDEWNAAESTSLTTLRENLISRLFQTFPELANRNLGPWLESELPLVHLCDLIATSLALPLEEMLAFLEEDDLWCRCQRLLEVADQQPARPGLLPTFVFN